MNSSIRSIVHPTDFSDLSAAAFAHALRIALATRSKLHLVHVSQYDAHEALAFPQARRLLVQWGLSDEDDPPSVVADKLGIEVDNIRLALQEPTRRYRRFSEPACERSRRARDPRPGRHGALAQRIGGRSGLPPLGGSDTVHRAGSARFRRSSERRYPAPSRAHPGRFFSAAGPERWRPFTGSAH